VAADIRVISARESIYTVRDQEFCRSKYGPG
jgi:hypothetical protein